MTFWPRHPNGISQCTRPSGVTNLSRNWLVGNLPFLVRLMINTDGAVDRFGNAAAGGLVRDHNGTFGNGFPKKCLVYVWSWRQNLSMGIWGNGLNLAKVLNCHSIILFAPIPVSAIKEHQIGSHPLSNLTIWLQVPIGEIHSYAAQARIPRDKHMRRHLSEGCSIYVLYCYSFGISFQLHERLCRS